MWRRSAAPTSAGTGTKGTPAIRHPVTASTVVAVGVARIATTLRGTDLAGDAFGQPRWRLPTRSLRLGRRLRAHGVVDVGLPGDGRGIECEVSRHVQGAGSDAGRDDRRVDPIECLATREVYRNPGWSCARTVRRPRRLPGIYGVVDKPTYTSSSPGTEPLPPRRSQFRYRSGCAGGVSAGTARTRSTGTGRAAYRRFRGAGRRRVCGRSRWSSSASSTSHRG